MSENFRLLQENRSRLNVYMLFYFQTQECGTGEEGSLYLALNLDGTDGMITKGK